MSHLIEQVYEAAFVPEQCPRVLDSLDVFSESASGAREFAFTPQECPGFVLDHDNSRVHHVGGAVGP